MKVLSAWSCLLLAVATPGLAVQTPVAAAATGAEAADMKRGRLLFIQCRACHEVKAGLPHKVGPNLNGMLGRKAWERSGQTTLVIDWPTEQRDENSAIVIDGQERSVPRTGELEFKGTWGQRRVVLTRKGYEQFVFDESLSRGVTPRGPGFQVYQPSPERGVFLSNDAPQSPQR